MSYQRWLLTLEGLNLHANGITAVLKGKTKARRVEGALLTAHLAGYLAAVFLVLSPGIAAVFIVVHQALWGIYMGSSFAPNHKGMPTMTGPRLPPQASADLPQPPRRADHRLRLRRSELPDRAPPVPDHAQATPASRTAHRAALLRLARNEPFRVTIFHCL